MTADRIELRALRVLARCGVLPEEVERAQPLQIDIVIETDLTAAGASDDLDDTIDYGAVVDLAVAATEGHTKLLERLAAKIADAVLAEPRVAAIEVSVRKLRPPVPHDLGTAGVALRRTRA